MRVQNEGTGKSSWWMINPDAKPGKSARRRAASMETSKFEKRRGRIKKKVDAIRSGLEATPSPSSSVSESLDLFPESPLHGFQLRYLFSYIIIINKIKYRINNPKGCRCNPEE